MELFWGAMIDSNQSIDCFVSLPTLFYYMTEVSESGRVIIQIMWLHKRHLIVINYIAGLGPNSECVGSIGGWVEVGNVVGDCRQITAVTK